MSMGTNVIGFAPPDETWERMKSVWETCEALGITVPNEVDSYFDGQDPDPAGVEIELPQEEWSNDYCAGIEIEVEKIPKHVKKIRFYNSW